MKGHRQLAYATESYTEELLRMIGQSTYPCIGAKAVTTKQKLSSFVASDLSRDADDEEIINFLYSFIDDYRKAGPVLCSAAVIFDTPAELSEREFDGLLWSRLQALADIDASNYVYDLRVSSDPSSRNFGFSIKSEALYVIGLHPNSSRPARRFEHPAIIFNPHSQFERLRARGKYDAMRRAVRQRDLAYAGSINPMLADFGESSEAIQYSGIQNGTNWKCPFVPGHRGNNSHSS
ncbi:MAG: guanitoxin biosynthesis heme-dependent pre-guanitoxin N-hydroxylase GntA [Chryseolinea sp.]